MVLQRITKFGTTLWTHKKKTIVGGLVVWWAADWAASSRRNGIIRTIYAREARKFGDMPISAEARPRRITVLGNVTANERHVWDEFTKNALPLLNLAGVEVNIIKADSPRQLEALASVINTDEADALFIVGGDGTMQRVLTAIYRDHATAALPMGFAPGGYDSITLRRIVPDVFNQTEDVRRWCESAMAVIEDARRPLAITQTTVITPADEPDTPPVNSIEFGLSPLSAGWFAFIDEKRRKFWYWASFKRRFAYFWEMLKRSPAPFVLRIEYEEFCPGCNKCRPPVVFEKPAWRWFHYLIGPPKMKEPAVKQRDFSAVYNERCGARGEATAEGAELIVDTEQVDDTSRLHIRVAGEVGRGGVIREGWSRCSADEYGASSREGFYSTDIVARSATLHLDTVPEFLPRVLVGGEHHAVKPGSTVTVTTTQRKVDVYLPDRLRVSADDIKKKEMSA